MIYIRKIYQILSTVLAYFLPILILLVVLLYTASKPEIYNFSLSSSSLYSSVSTKSLIEQNLFAWTTQSLTTNQRFELIGDINAPRINNELNKITIIYTTSKILLTNLLIFVGVLGILTSGFWLVHKKKLFRDTLDFTQMVCSHLLILCLTFWILATVSISTSGYFIKIIGKEYMELEPVLNFEFGKLLIILISPALLLALVGIWLYFALKRFDSFDIESKNQKIRDNLANNHKQF